MNSQSTTQTAADEDTIRAIHRRMIDAWNAGDSTAFAAPFTDRADFVAWDGTHLKGRREIAAFHRQIFDTVVKGSRLEGDVKFVHFLGPALAVMHSVVEVGGLAYFPAVSLGPVTEQVAMNRGVHYPAA